MHYLKQNGVERKKEEQSKISISAIIPTNENDLRKKEGQRRRRTNNSKLKNENVELQKIVQTLTKEIAKLRTSRSQTPPPHQSPSKIFLTMSVRMLNSVQFYVLKIKKKIFHGVHHHHFVLKLKHFYAEMILQNYVLTNTNKLIIIKFDIVLII